MTWGLGQPFPPPLPPSFSRCVVDSFTEKEAEAQRLEMTCPRSPAVRWPRTQTERATVSKTRSPHEGDLPNSANSRPCSHAVQTHFLSPPPQGAHIRYLADSPHVVSWALYVAGEGGS